MIFYGNGVVWDTRKNTRLCKFDNGRSEITGHGDCAYLIKLGYAHDPVDYGDVVGEPVESIEATESTPAKRGRKKKGAVDASE